jgi:hypothetical protein
MKARSRFNRVSGFLLCFIVFINLINGGYMEMISERSVKKAICLKPYVGDP